MDDYSSFDKTKRQTINPLIDEINRETEPLLKSAMIEFGFELPLVFRLYNQIRFYEEYGKLKMGTSVASKETLAKQFGVTVKQIEDAFHNLSSKYRLGKWVNHDEPVYRNVRRTWMSNVRYNRGLGQCYGVTVEAENRYSVTPEPLQRNTKSVTAYQLPTDKRPLSESKKKVSESKYITAKAEKDILKDLYYEVIKGLKVPVRNHNTVRSAINKMRKEDSEENLVKYLIFLRDKWTDINYEFKPEINEALDIYNKRMNIISSVQRAAKKQNNRKALVL